MKVLFYRFKADMFRLMRTKKYLLPFFSCVLLSIFFSYLMKNSEGDKGIILTISSLSTFIPLLFLLPLNFFWGDDFSFRTINTVIIKDKARWTVFVYKVFMTLFSSLLLIIICLAGMLITRVALGQQAEILMMLKIFFHQSPYYLYIVMLSIFLFNYFEKGFHAYIVYLIVVVFMDNILSYILKNILSSEIFQDFMMIYKLQAVDGKGSFLDNSSIIALVFSLVYLGISYYLFANHEFK